MLARRIEASGIPTVVVTMMPALATAQRTPRVVGVEFPFGHSFGMPGDRATQRAVLEAALRVLAGAERPGTRVDVDLEWPQPRAEAYRAWQPKEASPIVALMLAAAKESGGGISRPGPALQALSQQPAFVLDGRVSETNAESRQPPSAG